MRNPAPTPTCALRNESGVQTNKSARCAESSLPILSQAMPNEHDHRVWLKMERSSVGHLYPFFCVVLHELSTGWATILPSSPSRGNTRNGGRVEVGAYSLNPKSTYIARRHRMGTCVGRRMICRVFCSIATQRIRV